MGRQFKGLLYFFITDIRHSLLIFWSILLSILIVSVAVAYFLISAEDGFMTLSLAGPIYIYCAILGFLTVREAIPFSVKMGATRKNMFISLGIFFFTLSIVLSVIASTLQELVMAFANKTNIDTFSFVHLTYFLNDTWYSRILIDTSISFFFLAVMFVIGLLFYKYGLTGGGIFLGLLTVLLFLGIAQGWLAEFFVDIFKGLDLTFFYQLLVLGIAAYGLSFLLLRRITTMKVK